MLSITFLSCSQRELDILETKKEINFIMDNWHDNAKNANFENYINRISDNGVYIGTDFLENWNKKDFKAFSKPYFDKKETWDFKAIERNIYLSNDKNTVWFDELLNTWMGVCRGSGVLVKQKKSWQIKHYVLSVSIPNDEMKKVIKIKKTKDSVFLKNYKKRKLLKT